jgi:hypothetical protein
MGAKEKPNDERVETIFLSSCPAKALAKRARTDTFS